MTTIEPPLDPLFLPDIQAHLRTDGGADEGLLLLEYARAAMDYAQAFTRRAITTQTLELVAEAGTIALVPPLQSVTSVTVDGEARTYTVDVDASQIEVEGTGDATVRFVSGYDPTTIPSGIPAAIRAALLLLVGDLYTNRESQQDVRLYENATAANLLWPYRAF